MQFLKNSIEINWLVCPNLSSSLIHDSNDVFSVEHQLGNGGTCPKVKIMYTEYNTKIWAKYWLIRTVKAVKFTR